MNEKQAIMTSELLEKTLQVQDNLIQLIKKLTERVEHLEKQRVSDEMYSKSQRAN